VNTSQVGDIRLSMAGADLTLANSATGALATIDFHVLGGAGDSISIKLLAAPPTYIARSTSIKGTR
jgi:hypothetical protein